MANAIMHHCEGKSYYRVLSDKHAFRKENTVKFDYSLLVALYNDIFTAFQQLVLYAALLIPKNAQQRLPSEATWS